MGATIVVAVVDAPDDGAGGDEESTEAGPVQQIEKKKITDLNKSEFLGQLINDEMPSNELNVSSALTGR